MRRRIYPATKRPSHLATQRGLTLIEVTLLLVATSVLIGALSPALSATITDVRRTRALTDMNGIALAIQNFIASGFTMFFNTDGEQMEFVFSDGDTPNIGQSSNWRTPTNPSDKGFLEEHLVLNSIQGGPAIYTASNTAWRGAYINAPVDPDPWGNRYAVNAASFPAGGNDVVVFSAGPDEAVDTPDEGDPFTAVNDDIIVLIQS